MSNWCEEETEDENENASTDGYLQGLTASGLQHAHELEETSVAVERAHKNQPQGRRKIHSLGIAHISNQLGAEARQKIVQGSTLPRRRKPFSRCPHPAHLGSIAAWHDK